jgi:hypothetical protein
VNPENLLAEDNASDTICDSRARSIFKVGDILVTARLIYAAEAVESQVERLVVLDDGFVKRREQYIGVVARVNRSNNQTVVLASVATNDSGAHITTASVCREHFAL